MGRAVAPEASDFSRLPYRWHFGPDEEAGSKEFVGSEWLVVIRTTGYAAAATHAAWPRRTRSGRSTMVTYWETIAEHLRSYLFGKAIPVSEPM